MLLDELTEIGVLLVELQERFWVHADHAIDDELQPRQADAGVGDAGEIEGPLGVAHVHHDLGRDLGHLVERDLVDIEVDRDTGKITILRHTTFQDVGKAINPTLVEGQMQGGAAQGIGWAITEYYDYDEGVLRNPTLLDYRLPTALDLPMLDTEIIEVPASDGPYGARGVGEVPIVPPGGAIANAIYNAVGVRLYNLPMTPEAVFWALQAKQNGE